jgi:hypothetical protein
MLLKRQKPNGRGRGSSAPFITPLRIRSKQEQRRAIPTFDPCCHGTEPQGHVCGDSRPPLSRNRCRKKLQRNTIIPHTKAHGQFGTSDRASPANRRLRAFTERRKRTEGDNNGLLVGFGVSSQISADCLQAGMWNAKAGFLAKLR